MPATTSETIEAYRRAYPASVPLFFSQFDLLGGAERSMLAMATWLHQHRRAVHFVTYEDNCNFAQYASFALPIHELRPAGGNGARARTAALKHYFRAHAWERRPLVSGYQPALHATLAGVGAFHCLMHDTPVLFELGGGGAKQRLRTWLSNKIIGLGLRRGGRTIVTSEFLQRDAKREFGVKADIARMGGMGDAAAFIRRPFAGEMRLLSVCRIEDNKRIDWMLDALAALEQKTPSLSSRVAWRFDLAGNGSQLEAMRARAAELGFSERVRFHGFVSDEQLATLYAGAHLFLMPAVQGYGIPAIEALQRGIPVLLHRDSGVSDILLATPWASVLTGGREELMPKLEAMMQWIASNEHLSAPPPPELPTEETWAARVAALCGY